MKLVEPSEIELNTLFTSLGKQFPSINFRKIFSNYALLRNSRNEYFIMNNLILEDFKKLKSLEPAIRSVGTLVGRMRKDFGLALEILDFIGQNITKEILIENSIKLKSNQSKAFLYGKTVTIRKNIQSNKPLSSKLEKKLILDEIGDVIGLGFIKTGEDNLRIRPIVDLGNYLRSEDSGMFKS